MRVFRASCKDGKTGYELLLSECSYNMAMNWLEKTIGTYNVQIRNIVKPHHPCDLVVISTETKKTGAIMRTFFYDEERGYLLGE